MKNRVIKCKHRRRETMLMKLGVLADIHSNYEAFKSCVQYLEKIKVELLYELNN